MHTSPFKHVCAAQLQIQVIQIYIFYHIHVFDHGKSTVFRCTIHTTNKSFEKAM